MMVKLLVSHQKSQFQVLSLTSCVILERLPDFEKLFFFFNLENDSGITYNYKHIETKSESVSRWVLSLFGTPWTAARQTPLSLGFSREKSWSGLPFPSPGALPDPGIEPRSPASQADCLWSEPPEKPYIYLKGLWLYILYVS